MKKLISFSLFLFFVFNILSYSQNCKYVKNETDAFTKEVIKSTESELLKAGLMGGVTSKIQFIKKNNDFTFWIYYSNTLIAQTEYSVEENDMFMFQLEDETIIQLTPVKPVAMQVVNFAGTIVKSVQPTYYITLEQIEQLSKKKVIKIRIYLNGKSIEHEVKEKQARNFLISAKCILI